MGEYSFSAEATSAASPDAVFAILADATGWKDWAGWFIRESSWEREGTPAPGGVGAIKRLGAKPVYSREETVEYDPPQRYAYRILSGQPVKAYRADVIVAGTAILVAIMRFFEFDECLVSEADILDGLVLSLLGTT